MARKTISNSIEKLIVILFFLSITSTFFYSSLSQMEGQANISAPMYILFFPFVVTILQLFSVLFLMGSYKTSILSRSWLYIFIYYVISLAMCLVGGGGKINYNTAWFIICPPVAWWYFSIIIKAKPSLKDTLINLSFWVLIIFSLISLYFIPRSMNANGLFKSLNSGYYVLFIYPLAMLNNNKIKRIISTALMLLVVLLSMKRGGYVSIGLALIIYGFFASKINILKKLLVVGVSVGTLLYLIPKIDEMTYGTLSTRLEFSLSGGDEEGRADMYSRVWKAFSNSDFLSQLFGHGLNAVSIDKVTEGDAAHNDYLEFLYDFGCIGLFLLLSYQWQLFLITVRSKQDKRYFLPTIFAFTTIVVLSAVSIVYAFYYFLLIIPFWCIMNECLKTKKQVAKNENRNINI